MLPIRLSSISMLFFQLPLKISQGEEKWVLYLANLEKCESDQRSDNRSG